MTERSPGRVPGHQVRRHVATFLSQNPHLTTSDLARMAKVSRRTLAMLMTAPAARTVNLGTATKVLSVPLGRTASGPMGVRPASGVEARRQVEALMVMGWPTKVIASRAEVSVSTLTVSNLLPTASPATLRAINRTYSSLKYTLGPSKWTTTRARQRGYLPWAAWNGRMADPKAVPVLDGMAPEWVAAYHARQRSLADGST